MKWFEEALQNEAVKNKVEFRKRTYVHYQIRDVFLVNVYPTTQTYYIQGMENGLPYSSVGQLIQICKGEIDVPMAVEKTARRPVNKEAIFEKCSDCFVCGLQIATLAEATVEHKIPLSRGGSNRRDNLAVSHSHCNQARGNKLKVNRHVHVID